MNDLHQLDEFAQTVFENAKNKGFWEEERNKSELLMLIVSELAEVQEALRMPENPQSTKIPEFTLVEEELADCFIRLMDLCKGFNWRISEAILAKHQYNLNRPHKHGKLF